MNMKTVHMPYAVGFADPQPPTSFDFADPEGWMTAKQYFEHSVALIAAKRLAEQNPGRKVLIFKAVEAVESVTVTFRQMVVSEVGVIDEPVTKDDILNQMRKGLV